jgi:probable HAF family extracellular repeat protein
VIGSSWTSNQEYHPFLWNGSTMQDLGTLGGTYAVAIAINASGQVIGVANTTGNVAQHAFFWNGSVMQDLNALIDPVDPLRPYVTLLDVSGINDLGQIVADGTDSRTGNYGAYLVSPPAGVPCPPSGKVNVRFHYSANGSSGSWSGTKATSCTDGSVVIGPQAMEGDLKLLPGTTLKAGYDFTLPGNKASFTGTVISPSVVYALQCVSGAAPSPATLTAAMGAGSYPVSGSNWTPTGDQSSPLVYQGSTTVPNACNGGLVQFNKGGAFSAKILLN